MIIRKTLNSTEDKEFYFNIMSLFTFQEITRTRQNFNDLEKDDYKIWFLYTSKPPILELGSKANLTRIVRHLFIILFHLILTPPF